METTAQPHGFVTRGIHWVAAGLLAYGYLKASEDLAQMAHPGPMQIEVIFALLLGALFLARLYWTKRIAGATRLPEAAPKWEHLASRGVHVGLYASVFLIVLSGLGIALGGALPLLGGVFAAAMLAVHEFALVALPAFLVAHILGALWHKFIRRDGVLESMTGSLSK